jgi:hypothetical protein
LRKNKNQKLINNDDFLEFVEKVLELRKLIHEFQFLSFDSEIWKFGKK